MRDYELMVILDPAMSEEDIPGALERVANTITTHGGEPSEPQTEAPWGRRRLAYPINDQREGFYALYQLRLDPAQATEIDRDLKLNAQVMRFLVSRAEVSTPAPDMR